MTNDNAFQHIHQSVIVPENFAGQRLDQIISALWPEYSRSQHQKWLKDGKVTVDGKIKKAKEKLIGGEKIILQAQLENKTEWVAESIPLDIIFEDDDIIVINKPAGLVVHPGAGNTHGTVSNALLAHDERFKMVPRAGIVHRLDKDTTGLMVAAKSLPAHTSLVEQLSNRTVKREYEAITTGVMRVGGTVNAPIGRSPHNRLKMAVSNFAKPAVTHIEVIEQFASNTRIRCKLETGRTHQIRVHTQHLKTPLVGDPLYGARNKLPANISHHLREILSNFKRQALHAYHLSFIHPITKETVSFTAKPPQDFLDLLNALREDYKKADAQDEYTDYAHFYDGAYCYEVGEDDDDFDDDFEDEDDYDDLDDYEDEQTTSSR